MNESSLFVNPANQEDIHIGPSEKHTRICHGADNKGTSHGGFQVESVSVNCNASRWQLYNHTNAEMLHAENSEVLNRR